MEYIPLFLIGWMAVCLPAIVVTLVANNRRRRETAALSERITDLKRQLENLEQHSRAQFAQAQQPAPPMRVSAEETRPTAQPTARPASAPSLVSEPAVVEKSLPPIAVPAPPRPVVAAPIAAQTKPQAPLQSPPTPVEVGGIPLTPPRPKQPAAETPHAIAPPPPPPPKPRVVAAAQPMAAMADSSAQVRASAGSAGFTSTHTAYDIQP
ncbi:MAG TPA: hypothetical protein VH724_16315, partial [Candidatus Angelobacter sp.]|nr:hypothetical protein [Candidatus Angelobacter sp.]